jgi:AraC-like DNA-binding protein
MPAMGAPSHAASHGQPGPDRRPAAQSAWLDGLRAPDLRFAVNVFGESRLGPAWDTGRRSLTAHLVFGVSSGTVRCEGEGLPQRLQAGDLLWLSTGVVHRLRRESPAGELKVYHFNTALIRRGRSLRFPEGVLHATGQSAAVAELGQLRQRCLAAHPWWQVQVQAWLAWTYLRLAERVVAAAGPCLGSAQLARVEAWADARVALQPTPRELARVCGLSPAWFSRAFRGATGLSPRAWLLRRRILAAASRLEQDDAPIATVAERLGYGDPYLFSRQFRAVMGCSPLAFRRQLGLAPTAALNAPPRP